MNVVFNRWQSCDVNGTRRERAYIGGSGAKPSVGSRGKAPGAGVRGLGPLELTVAF